jgi:hypothetical protein
LVVLDVAFDGESGAFRFEALVDGVEAGTDGNSWDAIIGVNSLFCWYVSTTTRLLLV